MAVDDVTAGLVAALRVGAVTADVVAVEARRHAAAGGSGSDRHGVDQAPVVEHRVLSLTQCRLTDPAAVIAGLPADTRPAPSVAGYDELLTLRRSSIDSSTLKEETAS